MTFRYRNRSNLPVVGERRRLERPGKTERAVFRLRSNLQSCEMETALNTSKVLSYLQSCSSLESAWNSCDRADWMLWFLEGTLRTGMLKNEFESPVRLFAVWCAGLR
jgi:hypothetical protein